MLTFLRRRRGGGGIGSRGAAAMHPPRRRQLSSLLVVLVATVGLLSRSACGQWQGYDACDAPLGIDEAMLFLHGFRGACDD